MSWVYAYQAGPSGGALEDILDYADSVRIVAEWASGRRQDTIVPAASHGELPQPSSWHKAANLVVEVKIAETDNAGFGAHADGTPGEIYRNFSNLKRLFAGDQDTMVRLQRTAPHQGTVYIEGLLLSDAVPTQSRNIFGFPLRCPKPFWVGAAFAEGGVSVDVDGDGPVDDAVFRVVGGTDPRYTHVATGAYIEYEGAVPANGVDFDVGAGTVIGVSPANDLAANLIVNRREWIVMNPGVNAFTSTGTVAGTWTAVGNSKWR